MDLAVGSVLRGKVSGITKFGAFVSLDGGKSGLVHISEIANTYVSDVKEHLKLGQEVKVRVLNITDDGKINLSIKRAEEPVRENAARQEAPRRPAAEEVKPAAKPEGDMNFEDKLKRFMQEADSRIADNRMYSERKQRTRRR